MQKYSEQADLIYNAPMANFVRNLKAIGLYSYLSLVFYYPLYFFWLTPSSEISYIPLLLFWFPMLFAIKGLIKGNPYTYAWSNFVLMWCFIHGLTAVWTFEGNKVWVWLELLLLSSAFIGNTYFARYRGRELGLALPKLKKLKELEKQQFDNK